jgi:hypothetical protein
LHGCDGNVGEGWDLEGRRLEKGGGEVNYLLCCCSVASWERDRIGGEDLLRMYHVYVDSVEGAWDG